MIRKVKLAKINLTMHTGTIVRWLKREGDPVERDEPLLEVETDRRSVPSSRWAAGEMRRQYS